MAKIPLQFQNDRFSTEVAPQRGLTLINRGKVRDTYRLDDKRLLVIASDRLSIFDFVLPALVEDKGAVLTALTHFWLTKVLADYPNHFRPDPEQPKFNAALGVTSWIPELPLERALVVMDFSGQLDPYEFIFRHHIGGSVYKKYAEGKLKGYDIPQGLPKWSKLEVPIFTPTTKAEQGHDLPVSPDDYFADRGTDGEYLVRLLSDMYSAAYAFAASRGMLILDTKFEGSSKFSVVADEVLTPDSSRFADEADWRKALAEGREPAFFDKETVRIWGRSVETPFGVAGINNLEPENDEHVAFVHGLTVPPEILDAASERYRQLLERLTGLSLRQYQKDAMGIAG